MPYFEVNIPKDIFKQFADAQDDICKEMLTEAIPIVAESLKEELRKHENTGELIKSIETFEPHKLKDEYWIVSAVPTGKSKGLRSAPKVFARSKTGRKTSGKALYNDDKLWWLEYGTSKQKATPVLKKAINNANNKVIAKMTEIYNKRMGDL